MSIWDQDFTERLHRLESTGRLRRLKPVAGAWRPVLSQEGKDLINLSSSNYLGLADHPRLQEAARRALDEGVGATASRLVTGHAPRMQVLEERMAALKGTEAALIFGSGYQANVGVLAAILERGDAVFSDRLNHASIIDGIRLSGAECYRYRHRDLDHLESQLKRAVEKGRRRKLIVTETVFSMDGDLAPLKELVELKERYGAALMVDEAHGGGVFGERGEGVAAHVGVADKIDLHMGTFSKAYGVYGAYVAGRKSWIRYLVNTCRSLIYTTGLPPAVIGTIAEALELVSDSRDRRRVLQDKTERFRRGLQAVGLDTAGSTTQIVPVVVGGDREAVTFSQALVDKGVLGVAIRPPTVPEGRARIRFSLMSTHRDDDLERAVQAIREIADKPGGILRG